MCREIACSTYPAVPPLLCAVCVVPGTLRVGCCVYVCSQLKITVGAFYEKSIILSTYLVQSRVVVVALVSDVRHLSILRGCQHNLLLLINVWHAALMARSLLLLHSVIRLSLGKLLVNLLQVVKRTNTPLNTLTNGVVGRTMGFFGSWVRSPPSTIIIFSDFPHVKLEKYSPGYTQEMKRLG